MPQYRVGYVIHDERTVDAINADEAEQIATSDYDVDQLQVLYVERTDGTVEPPTEEGEDC
jgi:hypothetical protein